MSSMCPNHAVCGSDYRDVSDSDDGYCDTCTHLWLNALRQTHETFSCPGCQQLTHHGAAKTCDHWLCISCFRRVWFQNTDLDEEHEGEPPFPYDEDIQEEYERNPSHLKWDGYYQYQIDIWKRAWLLWYDGKKEERERLNAMTFTCQFCQRYTIPEWMESKDDLIYDLSLKTNEL